MNDRRVYLRPSQWCFCDEPTVVETVLGSCVALVLWSRGLGAISHAVLPEQGRFHQTATVGPATFVDACLDPMLGWFAAKGIAAADIHIKIFGGASPARLDMPASVWNTGARNADICRRLLAERALAPRVWEVGGAEGRKLFFHTRTGVVYVRRLAAPGAHA